VCSRLSRARPIVAHKNASLWVPLTNRDETLRAKVEPSLLCSLATETTRLEPAIPLTTLTATRVPAHRRARDPGRFDAPALFGDGQLAGP